ncbi:MAG TPA: hypothetical protein VMR95_02925 [Candidatus Binatia bacterium]|nr:hypothetical protein [Candidatus Binatia bacterium]
MKSAQELKALPLDEREIAIKSNRRGAVGALAGLLAAASIATAVTAEVDKGGFSSVAEAVSAAHDHPALAGTLILKEGTIIRNTLESQEEINTTQQGGNVAEVVSPNQAIVIPSPAVLKERNGVWYGFQIVTKSGNLDWVAIDGTDLSPQTGNYEVKMFNHDNNFSLSEPSSDDLFRATYKSNPGSLYGPISFNPENSGLASNGVIVPVDEHNRNVLGQKIAVGIEIPAGSIDEVS